MKTKAKIAFYKAKGNIFDKLIRFWTRSKYSHCEIVLNYVSYSSSYRDKGVRSKYINFKKDDWDLFDIEIDKVFLQDFYKQTMNKEYDLIGILFSQFLPLKVDDKNRYFCSEWCAEVLGVDALDSSSFSPEDLYEYISKKKQA